MLCLVDGMLAGRPLGAVRPGSCDVGPADHLASTHQCADGSYGEPGGAVGVVSAAGHFESEGDSRSLALDSVAWVSLPRLQP